MPDTIFEKNLAYIEKYNKSLVKKLRELKEIKNQINLTETKLKEPSLAFNSTLMHDPEGAQAEAERIFAKVHNTQNDTHVVFGLGLGYLFKEFADFSEGNVILFEPEIEVLRVVFEVVDFSAELSKPKVFVTNTIEEYRAVYIKYYGFKSETYVNSLPYYRQMYPELFDEILKYSEVLTGVCLSDFNNLRMKAFSSVLEAVKNIPKIAEEAPLVSISGIYAGKTAVIVSAGPTLSENIEMLKKYRDNYILFSVGTSLKTLVNNGISPDFLVVLEQSPVFAQIEDVDLSNTDMILEPYTNNLFHNAHTKNKFIFATHSAYANKVCAEIIGLDTAPYEAKGTVSYAALYSAVIMGFKKLILVGQDLAYIGGQCYSKNSIYEDLECRINPETQKAEVVAKDFDAYVEKFFAQANTFSAEEKIKLARARIKNINETLYFVKGVQGDILPTEGGYALFVEHFREFAKQFLPLGITLINSSMKGAQIDGFENIPFENAVKSDLQVARLEINAQDSFDKAEISKNLRAELLLLETADNDFKTIIPSIEKCEKEIKNRRCLTETVANCFNQILSSYDLLEKKYYGKSSVYPYLFSDLKLDIQHALKSERVDFEGFCQTFNYLKTFFIQGEPRIKQAITVFETTIKELDESTYTKG